MDPSVPGSRLPTFSPLFEQAEGLCEREASAHAALTRRIGLDIGQFTCPSNVFGMIGQVP